METNRTVLIAAGLVIAALMGVVVLALTRERGDAATVVATRVSMTEFAFSPDPVVSSGRRLEIVNDGVVAHDFVLPALGKGTPDVPPGGSIVLDLAGQPPGTYVVVCDLPGHREAGMETSLTLGD
jgi:plastocyanin